jgi:hypothetical protein
MSVIDSLPLIAERHDIQGNKISGQFESLPDILFIETGNDAGADPP